MKYRTRIYCTEEQKALMWDRSAAQTVEEIEALLPGNVDADQIAVR